MPACTRSVVMASGLVLGLVAALCLAGAAVARGEAVNASWILLAALCFYLLGYRVYSAFIAARVLSLDNGRATPAEVNDDGRDFVPTHRWIVFGHHFAAISGPGPLVGPVLAAQLGYLPGLIWIVVGAVVAGCVQDFVILFCSVRRNGRSLGQMIKDEVGPVAGFTAMVGIWTIMVILLAVIALVVAKALADSPWGTFTIACTIPIAMLMGLYMRYWRPGRVEEASVLGLVLVLGAVWAGGWVAHHAEWARLFTFSVQALAIMLMIYGFAASTLPVWLLLAPRDYLSTFVKIGTILGMALGLVMARPALLMPPVTSFAGTGMGPIWAGSVFPFCFITIACGAISGFHALISSGTTPKLLTKESHARLVGYGGMMMESVVAVMAMLAACVIQPGVYFAMNSPPALVGTNPEAVVQTITSWGFPVTTTQMEELTREVGEQTLYHRAGGAPTLAVGLAWLFARLTGGHFIDLWYHFAIMFEALFILTTLDAGTRVGRFMLQDMLGHFYKPLGQVSWWPSVLLSSGLMVSAWGYFLYQGVMDPLGGINSLWPLFGISNQMLAAMALCLGTVVLVKMGRGRQAWVTAVPLVWLVCTTQVAALEKIFHPSPRIGFLAQAQSLAQGLAARLAEGTAGADVVVRTQKLILNNRLDAVMAAFFVLVGLVVLVECLRTIWRITRGGRPPALDEAPYVPSRIEAETPPAAVPLSREEDGPGFEEALERRYATVSRCC